MSAQRCLFTALAASDPQADRDIMAEYLPAVPIPTTGPAIVVKQNVQGVVPSPLTDERFLTVSTG